MATTKVTITIPDDVLARIRQLVDDGKAPNVSAYISSVLARDVRVDTLAELVADMIAETGDIDPAEDARAREFVEAMCGRRQVA